jgi:hypothetical protein
MISHRVRISHIPRHDPAFRAAIERACVAAYLNGVGIDTPDAALIVEEHLRTHGYPETEISLGRTVEDYRQGVSNWVVRRDGRMRAKGATQRADPEIGCVVGMGSPAVDE